MLHLTPDVDISDSSKHSPPLVDWQAAREWILRLLFLLQVFPQAIMAEVRDKSASVPARAVVFVYVPSAHAVRALPAKGLDAALLPGLVENDRSSSGAYR